jgi:hypothetical protein
LRNKKLKKVRRGPFSISNKKEPQGPFP